MYVFRSQTHQERQSWNVRGQDTVLKARSVTDDDLNEKNDGSVTDFVEHSAGAEVTDIVRGRLDDGTLESAPFTSLKPLTNCVKDNGDQDNLQATEAVGNLGERKLDGGTDDATDDIDGGQ